jgi:hypothetical protein
MYVFYACAAVRRGDLRADEVAEGGVAACDRYAAAGDRFVRRGGSIAWAGGKIRHESSAPSRHRKSAERRRRVILSRADGEGPHTRSARHTLVAA